jgi:hypothetical protein
MVSSTMNNVQAAIYESGRRERRHEPCARFLYIKPHSINLHYTSGALSSYLIAKYIPRFAVIFILRMGLLRKVN